MSLQRVKDLHRDLSHALTRLKEALQEDASKSTIIIDGVIQRFEFTFELAWKLMKFILNYQGIEALTPRSVIKEAFKAKLIQEGKEWIDMLEDRNKTSHIYDEKEAQRIYEKIKDNHLRLLENLKQKTQSLLKDL